MGEGGVPAGRAQSDACALASCNKANAGVLVTCSERMRSDPRGGGGGASLGGGVVGSPDVSV